MSNEEIFKDLIDKLKKEHSFWSYDNSAINEISDDLLIAEVLLHLDIEDIQLLFKLFPKRKIQRVWQEKMLVLDPMYHGLNRLYSFLFFNIKNPDRYISYYKNKRYKEVICKD